MKLATTEDIPTDDEDLAFAGVASQARLLAEGEVSSQQLLQLYLERIAAIDGELRAFRCLREEAHAEAQEADRRLAAGERRPLLGVPVAIKDEFDIAGQETRFGCPGDFPVKSSDCESVRRLREAGAIVVGKTNAPELGQWPFTEGPAFGATRNPWSLGHTPGGSSGGTAAAVAAGLVAGATGADGAGSVRIPAAWTGLVGVKPQRGRISTWPEVDYFNGLACVGPLARTVGDAALMLDVLAGNHPRDAHKPPPPTQPFALAAATPPRRLRIALSLKIPFTIAPAHLQPQVRAAVTRLADVLAGLGHDVVEDDPPYGLIGLSFLPRSTMGLHELVQRVPDRTLLDPRTLHNARLGSFYRGPGLALGRALEAPFKHFIGRMFKRYDVVITPTTAKPPERIGAIDGLGNWDTDKVMVAACPYAWPWNVLGWPGVNVPAGLTKDGLPLGAQLLGPACSEPLLLSLAGELEHVELWHERRPPALVPQQLQSRERCM